MGKNNTEKKKKRKNRKTPNPPKLHRTHKPTRSSEPPPPPTVGYPKQDYAPSPSPVGKLHQPLQDGLKVRLLLGRDAVARDLAVGDVLELHDVDELVDRQLVGQVRLVAEHEQGDAVEGRLGHERVQLLAGHGQQVQVGNIDDKHDGVHVAAVPLPHWPEAGLAAQVPALKRHMPPLHPLHVEADSGYGAGKKSGGQPGTATGRVGRGGTVRLRHNLGEKVCSVGKGEREAEREGPAYSMANSPPW